MDAIRRVEMNLDRQARVPAPRQLEVSCTMTPTKSLPAINALVGLAASATALLSQPAPAIRRPDGPTPPYYMRTGFLSNLLQELNTAPTGLASIHVPDGFEVTLAAKPGLVTYPMFIAFDDRGRLFVCESA